MPAAPISIIDIFAGPGGLGEGFSRVTAAGNSRAFQVALSIEKDTQARATLKFRSFMRGLRERDRRAWRYVLGHLGPDCPPDALYERYPKTAAAANREAWCLALGPDAVEDVRSRIDTVLPRRSDPWVLIGGPPCQAYSLVGRSRNRGINGYVFERDSRAQLYLEYLQILADHQPAVFVMENVKGLLSAMFGNNSMFSLIRRDLEDPASALASVGRRGRGRPRYDLYALSPGGDAETLFGAIPAARDFIVRAERHGVPQARHRVIIVGVSHASGLSGPASLELCDGPAADAVLRDLPRLRSGLSAEDSPAAWAAVLRELRDAPWVSKLPPAVKCALHDAVTSVSIPRSGRGAERLPRRRSPAVLSGWFGGPEVPWVWNHSSRGHIPADIRRYVLAAAWGRATGESPDLGDFPAGLLPHHRNASSAADGGLFSDRFRVQVSGRPATTVTSHISKDGHYYIHPDPTQARSLTVREAARLQTFPDDYFFCGPRTSQYTQVGNAVPPYLAWQIGRLVGRMFGVSVD